MSRTEQAILSAYPAPTKKIILLYHSEWTPIQPETQVILNSFLFVSFLS